MIVKNALNNALDVFKNIDEMITKAKQMLNNTSGKDVDTAFSISASFKSPEYISTNLSNANILLNSNLFTGVKQKVVLVQKNSVLDYV